MGHPGKAESVSQYGITGGSTGSSKKIGQGQQEKKSWSERIGQAETITGEIEMKSS